MNHFKEKMPDIIKAIDEVVKDQAMFPDQDVAFPQVDESLTKGLDLDKQR